MAVYRLFCWCIKRAGRLALIGLMLGIPAFAGAEPVHIIKAEFIPAGESVPAQSVTLPDTWAARGLPVQGHGFYRLRFDLNDLPDAAWALHFERLAPRYRMRLNGHLLDTDLSVSHDPPVLAPQPVLVMVPPEFLVRGTNHIDLQVGYSLLAGLAVVHVGAVAELLPAFQRQLFFSQTLPLVLNVGGAALALFMVLIWWKRRSEEVLGGFGAFWAIASIRNVSYYIHQLPLPVPVVDWLYFASQVVGTVLLGRFTMVLSGLVLPGYRLLLLLAGAVMLPLGVWAAWVGELALARLLAYPVLMSLLVPALFALLRSAIRLRGRLQITLAVGLVLVVGVALHDFLYLRGVMPVTDWFWLPYMVPLALGVFAWTLIERLVDALRQEQQLNIELERRVQERTLALQQANAAKTRFLASASHDLRQPVVAIGLMVGLLREQIRVPSMREMIDRVDEAVASMESLLAGLLDLSRLEAGTVQPRRERVALQHLFDAIGTHEAEVARHKRLQLRFRPTRLVVQSDPVLLEQILRNLVTNALRYTDRGGVLVAARQRGRAVLIQVWDTGRGIAINQQDLVFEEFVQVGDRGRDSREGMGLGLAIVRRASLLLGHVIRLRSVPGKGSCFSVEVPRIEGVAVSAPVAQMPREPLHGYCIVLVEDDQGAREALAARLEHWGAEVHACDGLPTLRELVAAGEVGPDLLITDQRLPGGSGLSAIAHMRQHHPQVPALVVTGNTAPAELAVLTASGLPVLHKPFRSEALLDAIHQLLP